MIGYSTDGSNIEVIYPSGLTAYWYLSYSDGTDGNIWVTAVKDGNSAVNIPKPILSPGPPSYCVKTLHGLICTAAVSRKITPKGEGCSVYGTAIGVAVGAILGAAALETTTAVIGGIVGSVIGPEGTFAGVVLGAELGATLGAVAAGSVGPQVVGGVLGGAGYAMCQYLTGQPLFPTGSGASSFSGPVPNLPGGYYLVYTDYPNGTTVTVTCCQSMPSPAPTGKPLGH